MNVRKPKGLGRGLDALLGADRATGPAVQGGAPAADGGVASLPLAQLQPGRYQPRTRMDEAALQDLAASIRNHGMMQPILVRRIDAHRHEIIAGERRFRAAQIAGLQDVPVIVRDVSDENALAMALIENIQREDLNPLEEAQAIKRLIDDFAYTHERAAEAIGRSRSATSNLLRLLNLAPAVQTMLLAGDLEMGHARALLALDRAQQILVANRVSDKRLSVREAERLVAQALAAAQLAAPVGSGRDGGRPDGAGSDGAGAADGGARDTRGATRRPRPADRDLERMQERIADHLATPVELRAGARGRGRLVIHFDGAEQFEGLLDALGLRDAVTD